MHAFSNIRYSFRALTRTPGFTTVVVLTVALAVGANVAIFSVVDAVLLNPLPYEDSDRLALVWGVEKGSKTGSSWTSFPDFVDFERDNRVFTDLAAWSSWQVTLTGGDRVPTRVSAARVSHDLFPVLGVQPGLGRGILPDEDEVGAAPVVVVSHAFWTTHAGGDPAALGRTLTIDGKEHEIVGVMPEGFQFPATSQLWIPVGPKHAEDSRGMHRLLVMGRLREGVGLEQANADMRAVAAALEEQYPESNHLRSASVQSLYEAVVGSARPSLVTIFGAVGFVLLTACANVASLYLSRVTDRSREFGIHKALGAGRASILRLYLTESMLLALAGGALGVVLSSWGVDLILSIAPQTIPRIGQVGLNGHVLLFALATTLLAGMLFGLAPALQGWRGDLLTSLKGSGGQWAKGGSRPLLRQSLVVVEVALAFVLVIGASLLVNSYVRLQRVDPGYTARRVLAVPLSLPESVYPDWRQATQFYATLTDRLREIPAVEAAAAAYQHPMAGGWETSFAIPGVVDEPHGQRPEARIRPVTPGFFQTVGIPLLQGRDFTGRDDEHAPGVVIVNQSFAQQFFPDGDALGHRLVRGKWWDDLHDTWEIVGVVGDVKMDGLSASTPWAMYYPHTQIPFGDMYVFLRTAGDPMLSVGPLKRAVHELDANLPVENIRTLEEIRTSSTAGARFRVTLLVLFAAAALLLAAIGIYGILSASVSQRRGEIGVRMALGARSDDVLRVVVLQGVRLALVGVVLGALGAFGVTRLMSSLLFGIGATDPPTFLTVGGLFLVVALAACLIPAARATRVDPMIVLRAD